MGRCGSRVEACVAAIIAYMAASRSCVSRDTYWVGGPIWSRIPPPVLGNAESQCDHSRPPRGAASFPHAAPLLATEPWIWGIRGMPIVGQSLFLVKHGFAFACDSAPVRIIGFLLRFQGAWSSNRTCGGYTLPWSVAQDRNCMRCQVEHTPSEASRMAG